MFRLYSASDPERLVQHLAATLDKDTHDVFDRVVIITPNATVSSYLKLALARTLPIVANVDFVLLESFLGDLKDGMGDPNLKPLTAEILTTALLDVLEDLPHEPEFGPVHAYLNAAEGTQRATDTRRVQLAQRLAGYFREYAFSRPQMLDAWAKNQPSLSGHFAVTEAWQMALWNRLFDQKLILHTARGNFAFPAQIFERIGDQDLKHRLTKNIYLYGFPNIGDTFQKILKRISSLTNVTCFTLTPFADSKIGTLSPRWEHVGKVGYDALRALADDSQQVDARLYPRVLNERAITIHKCTGIQRETEVVCNTIWDLLMRDPQLKLTDIAVVIASQMDAYAASLEASFKHRGTYIDYKFAGYRAVAESPVIAAIRALLDLPESDFKRSDVLNVLLHPNVRTRCQNANPSAWLKWCDETNIRHGISRESHLDTYIKDDVLNWDQGLFRLAIGTVLDQPLHASLDHFPVVGQNIGEVAAFHSFARSLLNDARWLAGASLPLTEWMMCIADLIDIYVGVDFREDGPDKDDLVALAAVRRTLVELGEQATSVRHVSYRTASRLIQSQLENLIFQSDQIFVDGVTVGSPTSLQGIPFKHVFMLGMNEGDFPVSDLDNPLDLRTAQTHVGDVKPNARDRYAFFQILSSVEKSLHISYVARDPYAGSETDPSSVVSELLSWLREEGVDTIALTRKHPLRRYQESGHRNFLFEAHDEAIHHQHGRQLRRHFAEANLPIPHQEILRNYSTEFPNILKLRFPEVSAKNYRENTKNIQVKLGSITRFLKSPLNGMASHQIGFLNDDEDFTERDQENFGDGMSSMTVKLRNAFWDAMQTGSPGDALEDVIDSHFGRVAELKGDMPTGIFHGYSLNDVRKILGFWADHWAKKFPSNDRELVRYAIGVEPEKGKGVEPLESLKITVKNPRHLVLGGPDEVQVEIVGVTCPIVTLGALVVKKVHRKATYFLQFATSTAKVHHALEGYSCWLVLKALGMAPPASEGVMVVYGSEAKQFSTGRYTFQDIPQNEAVRNLQQILGDLLFPTEDFSLPVEHAKTLRDAPNTSLSALLEKQEEDSDQKSFDLLSDTERYMLPADPDEKIARYFSGFMFSKELPKTQQEVK